MESQTIEYKQSWHDEYLEWICGYANASGGTLFIGKDDNGRVVGLMGRNRAVGERNVDGKVKSKGKGKDTAKNGAENKVRVLQIIQTNSEVTKIAIAKQIGLSLAGVEKIMRQLVGDGIIVRVGSRKCGHWEVVIGRSSANSVRSKATSTRR